MRTGTIVATLLVTALAARSSAEVYLQVDEALRLAFHDADEITKERAVLTPDDQALAAASIGGGQTAGALPRILSYHVARRAGAMIGLAMIDDAPGKSQPITFMVAARPGSGGELEIERVEILAYRESHGWEVRRPEWLRQFEGKRANDEIRHGRDIANIAGATISCRSVTDRVRRDLALLRVVARLRPPPPTQKRFERTQLVMGTSFTITCFASDPDLAQRAMELALAEGRRLDALLSTYIADSEVSELNRAAGAPARDADPELVALLVRALELVRVSGGAFDPAMGPLVQLWREAARAGAPPADAAIAAARAVSGSSQITVDSAARKVGLREAGAALDLGAIGKGFALDRAAAALEERGVTRALLDLGGQLLALDPPPGEPGWPVEVRDPRGGSEPLARLRLRRESIATTADDQRGLVISGARASHVVDPRSGLPAHGTLSASVIAADATTADALSTAVFVLGAEAGARVALAQGAGSMVLSGDGHLVIDRGFEVHLEARSREEAR